MQLQSLLQARLFRRSFLLAPLRMVLGKKSSLKRVRTARQCSIQAGPVPTPRTSSITNARPRKASSRHQKMYSHLKAGKPVKYAPMKKGIKPATRSSIPSSPTPLRRAPPPRPVRVPSFTADNVAEVVDEFFANLPPGHDRGFGADAFIAEVHRLADDHYLKTKIIPGLWADQRVFNTIHDERNIALNRAHWKAHDNAIKFRRERAGRPIVSIPEEVEDAPVASTSSSTTTSTTVAMGPPTVPASLKSQPSLFDSTDSAKRSSFSKSKPTPSTGAAAADGGRPRGSMKSTRSGAPLPSGKLGRQFTDLMNEARRKAAHYTEEVAAENAAAEEKKREKERALAAKLKADESLRRHREAKLRQRMQEGQDMRQRSMEEKRKSWEAKEKAELRRKESLKKEQAEAERLYRLQAAQRRQHEEHEKEQIRRTQEMHERARNSNSAKFELHEALWKALKEGVEPNGDPIPPVWGHQLPWPVLDIDVTHPSQITLERVKKYVLHAQRPGLQSTTPRNRIRAELLRWHPDKFGSIVTKYVVGNEEERVGILAAASAVAQFLNDLKALPEDELEIV